MKYELENGWNVNVDKQAVFDFCEGYKKFLNNSKTERESVISAVKLAEKRGFAPLSSFSSLKPGDKVYSINKEKEMLLAIIGTEPIENGVRIVGSHIDAPRLDLKPNPLYEDSEMAFFKTHYYGRNQKYRDGCSDGNSRRFEVKESGERVDIKVGDEGDDVTFVITDLLPHLAGDQMKKSASEVIDGENLNLLIGSMAVRKIRRKRSALRQIFWQSSMKSTGFARKTFKRRA